MARFGSKAMQSRRPGTDNSMENPQMGGEGSGTMRDGKKKKNKNRRPAKEHHEEASLRNWDSSIQQNPVTRKQVDPETTKYFTEIANLLEGTEMDVEERSAICGNALEETRGKESEVATDYILSHTLQTLLEGCDVDSLCGFLQRCVDNFLYIAMDRSGSHVVETALKSLSLHGNEGFTFILVVVILLDISREVVANALDLMCSCYGSHVLRSLLCVCKGVSVDALEDFHTTKKSATLVKRLMGGPIVCSVSQMDMEQSNFNTLKLLGNCMLYHLMEKKTFHVNQLKSPILFITLRSMVEQFEGLFAAISVYLCFAYPTSVERDFIVNIPSEMDKVSLAKSRVYKVLVEVILEVAPETLYSEILTKVFKGFLFETSSLHCGSFIIQALVSSARCKGQMDLIWVELGGKFKELLEIGRAGVVASILAASQRLQCYGQKCCQALSAAMRSTTESPNCIVPRIFFFENYFICKDKSSWRWSKGDKMNVLGCLMLQTVFNYPSEYIQSYAASISSMESGHVLETAKNAGGARVIESFLCSGISAKQKCKLIAKLQGYFGELAMHPSGSFLVEKCFSSSNMPLKETIAAELSVVRSEISKTKQGPYLLRKLDIEEFAAKPEQWKSKQTKKQDVYKEFYDVFGPGNKKRPNENSLHVEPSSSKHSKSVNLPSSSMHPKSVKNVRKEIDLYLGSTSKSSAGSGLSGIETSLAKLGFTGHKRFREGAERPDNYKFSGDISKNIDSHLCFDLADPNEFSLLELPDLNFTRPTPLVAASRFGMSSHDMFLGFDVRMFRGAVMILLEYPAHYEA
ncbi:hypothetical protein Scep_012044 [Stephania cephalantha]|uniref:Uncharacterized protein n=1 Tax=Stephania cephalantha TaxID=152367 RepID=A0AAP0JE88_9MAGN